MKIIAQAPCRLSLFGGGTDVDPFAFKFGGQVLNLAIDLYHETTLILHPAPEINLRAMGDNRQIKDYRQKLVYKTDPKFDLIRAIINWFRPKIKSGFDLKIELKTQAATGLGSSASAAVTAIAAFDYWLKTGLTKESIGLLAGNLEVEELGWAGGKQDGIAAALGGVNLIYFGPGGEIKVQPIELAPKLTGSFLAHTVLFYIGGARHSGEQQKHLISGMSEAKKLAALRAIKDSVDEARDLLGRQNWRGLGQLMHQGWLNKKITNPIASNKQVDRFYDLAIKTGAYGGKLLGSGGAGHLFFFVDPVKKETLVRALEAAGARLVKFAVDYQGVRVKQND